MSALLRAVAIEDCPIYSLSVILPGAKAVAHLLQHKIRWDSFEVHFESHKFLKKLSDIALVSSKILCKDAFDYEIYDGLFVCETGNALIDFRVFFKSATNTKPIALFFQVKHSEWEVEASKITFKSLSSWYQNCDSSLAAFGVNFRLGFVVVTNRLVQFPANVTPSSTLWPPNLILISRHELDAFLGPLSSRGLLAIDEHLVQSSV
jgi:hypothetical protein